MSWFNSRFLTDERGKVVRLTDDYSNRSIPIVYWRQDSLILHALELFESGRDQEVLRAFRKAYSENPEHYYLANYIKYLEFVLSNDYPMARPVLEPCTGAYGPSSIYMENGKFYLNRNSMDYEILPLSENQFMNPSQYNYTLQLEREENHISGLKIIFNNGNEIYSARTGT